MSFFCSIQTGEATLTTLEVEKNCDYQEILNKIQKSTGQPDPDDISLVQYIGSIPENIKINRLSINDDFFFSDVDDIDEYFQLFKNYDFYEKLELDAIIIREFEYCWMEIIEFNMNLKSISVQKIQYDFFSNLLQLDHNLQDLKLCCKLEKIDFLQLQELLKNKPQIKTLDLFHQRGCKYMKKFLKEMVNVKRLRLDSQTVQTKELVEIFEIIVGNSFLEFVSLEEFRVKFKSNDQSFSSDIIENMKLKHLIFPCGNCSSLLVELGKGLIKNDSLKKIEISVIDLEEKNISYLFNCLLMNQSIEHLTWEYSDMNSLINFINEKSKNLKSLCTRFEKEHEKENIRLIDSLAQNECIEEVIFSYGKVEKNEFLVHRLIECKKNLKILTVYDPMYQIDELLKHMRHNYSLTRLKFEKSSLSVVQSAELNRILKRNHEISLIDTNFKYIKNIGLCDAQIF